MHVKTQIKSREAGATTSAALECSRCLLQNEVHATHQRTSSIMWQPRCCITAGSCNVLSTAGMLVSPPYAPNSTGLSVGSTAMSFNLPPCI